MTGPPPHTTDCAAKDLPPLTISSTRRSIEVSTDSGLSTEMVGHNDDDEDRRREEELVFATISCSSERSKLLQLAEKFPLATSAEIQ
eukprot:scaffold29636_cov50-Attheya_sp.AAC.1